jgi:hypothetical protein
MSRIALSHKAAKLMKSAIWRATSVLYDLLKASASDGSPPFTPAYKAAAGTFQAYCSTRAVPPQNGCPHQSSKK